MTPEFFRVTDPLKVNTNNPWGKLDPAYRQFGFERHNGTDIAHGKNSLLFAPKDYSVIRTGDQPTGGGIFIGLITNEPMDFPAWDEPLPEGGFVHFPAGRTHVLIDLLHCSRLCKAENDRGIVGDTVAIAGNTGFSTGPHTHIQARRVRWTNISESQVANVQAYRVKFSNGVYQALLDFDRNQANNSFNILRFTNHLPAPVYTETQKELSLFAMLISKMFEMLKGRNLK